MTSFIQPSCPSRTANHLCPAGACHSCDRARRLLRRVAPEAARQVINFYAVFYVDAEGVIWFTTPREHKWICDGLPQSRRYWVSEAVLAVGMPVERQMGLEL